MKRGSNEEADSYQLTAKTGGNENVRNLCMFRL
jgi:hypothetical protein